MPRGTNMFFNNTRSYGEQTLVEDLIIEAIKIYGVDLWYLPRTIVNKDEVFSEEELVTFNQAILIEMYPKNVDGFEGEGDFLSKFGVQIRDQITFTVARRVFSEEVTSVRADVIRPREGDLLWFPMNEKLFEIKFVEHEAIFYQMGALQTFDLRCELFEYNNEKFAVGIPQIDNKYRPLSQDIGSAEPEAVPDRDPFAQNDEFEQKAAAVIDWSERDPFSEGLTY